MDQTNRGNPVGRVSDEALDVELEGHPLYQQALSHLQRGEWQEAIARLSQLSDQHPESRQVKTLLDEVRLKASLDEGTRVEAKRPSLLSNRWIRVLLLANLIVILINLILHFGRDELLAYQRQWQLYVANRRRQTAVAHLLQEGQRQLATGDYESAARSFEEALALWPDHQEAREGLSEAAKMTELASLYEQAMAMVEEGRWEEALEGLGRIAEVEPNYRDVAQQMAFVRRRIELAELLDEAERLYQASDWQGAAAKYEEVRRLDLNYQKQVVEDRLFECYLSWGMELVEAGGSVEAVREALALFEKALALRPLEARAEAERRLAQLYVEGYDLYQQGRWEEAVVRLEEVYLERPDYVGEVAQLLYEAYLKSGAAHAEAGAFELAQERYRKALEMEADEEGRAAQLLYEAYVKGGDACLEAGSYELACEQYRQALQLRGYEGEETEAVVKVYVRGGDAYFEAADYRLAAEQYRRALEVLEGEEIVHFVQPGEYLVLIASRYNTTVEAIVAANDIPNPSLILAGQRLVIPLASSSAGE